MYNHQTQISVVRHRMGPWPVSVGVQELCRAAS